MKKSKTLVVVALAAVGLLVAQSSDTSTDSSTTSTSMDEHDWELVAGTVAGWPGSAGSGSMTSVDAGWIFGDMFLYNKSTGKAYRYFDDCGDSAPAGCFGAIPVLEEADAMLAVTPKPQSGRISGDSH